MTDNTDWKARRDALLKRMGQLQAEIQAETGKLDQRIYRRRLVETGLQAEWDALQADPNAIKPLFTTFR